MAINYLEVKALKVKTIQTDDLGERYLLLDNENKLVFPVMKFIKFKDNVGASRNTLRRLCFNLKLFFEFLSQISCLYSQVDLDIMAEFVRWLKLPMGSRHVKVTTISEGEGQKIRSPRTINYIVDDVIRFYDYLNRSEEYNNNLNDQLKKEISYKNGFKPFLYHVANNKDRKKISHVLKQRVPKEKHKVLSKEQTDILLEACTNIRDQLLIYLLLETGCRIGEALALHLSDIDHARGKIHIVDRGVLKNKAEIKTVGSVRTIDCSRELTNLYSDYLLIVHDDPEVDTDFVFIKLSGENKYQPMDYITVVGLFNRLKEKTGIDVHPHMFRHTSLTWYAKKGMRTEVLQKRAGHAQYQTTEKYTHFDEEDVRKEWERVRGKE